MCGDQRENDDDQPKKEENFLPNIKKAKELLHESAKVNLKENTTVFKDRHIPTVPPCRNLCGNQKENDDNDNDKDDDKDEENDNGESKLLISQAYLSQTGGAANLE